MFYNNEDDEGDLSPNISSEEFRELAEKNENINNSQLKMKPNLNYSIEQSIDDDEDQKNIAFTSNNNISNRIDSEEKQDYPNMKTNENENYNEQNEHEIINSNENEPKDPSNTQYLEIEKNNKENEIENAKTLENKDKGDDKEANDENGEYNIQNKFISTQNNKLDSNIEKKENEENKYPALNFSYFENDDDNNFFMNNYTDRNNNNFDNNFGNTNDNKNNNYNVNLNNYYNEQNVINNNDKNENKKLNEETINMNNYINKNGNEFENKNNDKNNNILKERNMNYAENEINNNYQAFLNENLNLIQKEMNDDNDNNIENNIANNLDEKSYQAYPINDNKNNGIKEKESKKEDKDNNNDLEKRKNEKKILIKDTNNEEELEENNNINNNNSDSQKYYFSYDNSSNIHSIIQKKPKKIKYDININNDLRKNNEDSLKEAKENEIKKKIKELSPSDINMDITDRKVQILNINNGEEIISKKENISNNIITQKDNYNNYNINDNNNNNIIINQKDNLIIEDQINDKNKDTSNNSINNNYFNKTTIIQKSRNFEKYINNNNADYFKLNKDENKNLVTLTDNNDNIDRNKYLNKNINNNYNNENNNIENLIINPYKNKNLLNQNQYNIYMTNYKNYAKTDNSLKITDSQNMMNTLESFAIKKIDEEEEKRTMELEQETKRLSELEFEKKKLIEEQKEIRQKILEEIERQEKKEKEKKKIMKIKYAESMKKKKEDEERLKQIRIQQEMHLKEINELKYQKQLEEQKLLLLVEGKLNKREIKNYRKSINNEDIFLNTNNQSNNPFITVNDNINFNNIKEREDNKSNINNEYTLRNNNKYYNLNMNKLNNDYSINDNTLNYRENNFNKKKLNGIKTYPLFVDYYDNKENNNFNTNTITNIKNGKVEKNNNINIMQNQYLPTENLYTISTSKNKNFNQITFNPSRVNEKDIEINEYMTFSPSIIPKKETLSLSPNHNLENNQLQAELDQLVSFSPMLSGNNSHNINEYINAENKNQNIVEVMSSTFNEKKIKKNIKKNTLKKSENNIKNKFNDKKNLKEKLINHQENENLKLIKENDLSGNNSFNELNQIKELTSKIKNDIDKRVDTIRNSQNKNIINSEKVLCKAKSSSKINPYLKYQNNTYYNRSNNKFLNGRKESKSKEENKNKCSKFIKETNKEKELLNERNNKYIYGNEEKMLKQKSFMEDFALPSEIKKECLMEINKLDKTKKKDKKSNSQMYYGTSSTSDSRYMSNKSSGTISKIKKYKPVSTFNLQENNNNKVEEFKNYKTSSQRVNYREYINESERNNCTELNENLMNEQNNSKFLLYYKEIYGDNKK